MGVLYRNTGAAMLRATAAPLTSGPAWWPDPDIEPECRRWLAEVWADPLFAEAVQDASPALAAGVGEVLHGRTVSAKRVRSTARSTIRYLLRSTGRPTPFGLFAGVADVTLGPAAVTWGNSHRPVARANTEWLADVVGQLEAFPDLLDRLTVVFNNLAARRGGRLQVPHGGPHRVSIRSSTVIETTQQAAGAPVRFRNLVETVTASVPGATVAKVSGMLTELVRRGFLISCLRAPLTVTDPLAHVLDELHNADAKATTAAPILHGLEAVRAGLQQHNQQGHNLRVPDTLTSRLRDLSAAGRTPLAVDLLLDCAVSVPGQVLRELERAADLLLRLTRETSGQATWRDYHAAFWERYSTGVLVPVTDLLDPATGLGYPAEYPGSTMPVPASGHSQRDERLLALAWQAMADHRDEIVLTDDTIDHLTEGTTLTGRLLPPHVEVAARVHATSTDALNRGEFTLAMAPARAAGTLTSRFTLAATGSGLAGVYRDVPAMTEGAIRAQLSFPPLYPHTENVCRVPAYLPHVIALGEHREPSADVVPLDDLAVTATRDRLHLVSISRRQVVEPLVFHAMALDKQPPPLARFLAHLPRGFAAGWTGFDWGPYAHRLPHLPRVRYRNTVLSPARWNLAAADLAAADPKALTRWRERWSVPQLVELREDDRTLRLDLNEKGHTAVLVAHLAKHGTAVLTESPGTDSFGWIGGHAHEIALPLTAIRPPAPDPLKGRHLPVVAGRTHGDPPGSPQTRWLNARIQTHPEQYDEIITTYLPRLLAELGEPPWWFVRYRSPHESDHLRLRLRTPDPGRQAAALAALGRWAALLRDRGLAGELVLSTYRPETGRYGTGPALEAAEEVFAADSRLVAAALRNLPPAAVHPTALVVMNLAGIARGFLGHHGGMQWLANRPAPTAPYAERAVANQASQLAQADTLPDVPGWRGEVSEAWQFRTAALVSYRSALPADTDTDAVLEALLHMHHNRALGLDPDGEKTCRRLARQAAITWRSLSAGGSR